MGKRKRASRHFSESSLDSGVQRGEKSELPPEKDVDVIIDGSFEEGGGQIVRIAVALSSILDKSVRIDKIRHGRPRPGLQAQHSAGVCLVREISQAELYGSAKGSTVLTIFPQTSLGEYNTSSKGPNSERKYPLVSNVGTAGAVSLVLQAVLPVAVRFLSGCENQSQTVDASCTKIASPVLRIKGGTTALFAPTADYVRNVLSPNLRLFGIDVDYHVEMEGFFPRGGGSCMVSINKSGCACTLGADENQVCTLRPCHITSCGKITEICGRILICGLQYERNNLAEELREGALSVLKRFTEENCSHHGLLDPQISVQKIERRTDKHLSITLWAKTEIPTSFGASSVWSETDALKLVDELGITGSKASDNQYVWKRTAAHVGSVAAEELCASLKSGAAVDSHMADQLCVFMGMASGTSRLLVPPPTKHLLAVLGVMRKFGMNIWLEDVVGSLNKLVVCDGVAVHLR